MPFACIHTASGTVLLMAQRRRLITEADVVSFNRPCPSWFQARSILRTGIALGLKVTSERTAVLTAPSLCSTAWRPSQCALWFPL